MNCQKIETFIAEVAREQMMETSVREDVRAHCESCCSCARKLVEQRSLTNALHELAESVESVEAPQLIENNLLATLRIHVAAKQLPRTKRSWARDAAAAAILLAVMSAAVVRVYHHAGEKTAQPSNVAKATNVPANDFSSSSQLSEVPAANITASRRDKPKVRSRAVRAPAQRAVSLTASSAAPDYATEIATEFLPLGYGNSLNLQDGGQIVRVEVPRSALVSFGLPVSMNRSTERVKADVLFGADGSARAIRFVQ